MRKAIPNSMFFVAFITFVMLSSTEAFSQENPPIPISVEVNTARFLNFGAFTVGTNGGNVSVSYDGNRTANGDVFLLNLGDSPSAALFDVTANPGTIISISTPPTIELTGTNGGNINLTIDSFSTGQTFITTANPPNVNEVFVGGTLNIPNGASADAGRYNGNFTLTFIHQ